MRITRIVSVVLLASLLTLRGADQWEPPPFPDPDPWDFPLDPPDVWDDPFDPISDLPDPQVIDFPPEDPFDDPFIDDIPLPDPPGLEDPFPDEPSLFSGEMLGYIEVAGSSPSPRYQANAAAASNVLTKLMPFPMRLPLHPAGSGVGASRTTRNCDAATASKMIIPESGRTTVAFMDTCPFKVTARVTVGTAPAGIAETPDGQFAWVTSAGSGSISIVDINAKSLVTTFSLPPFNGNAAQPSSIAISPDGSRAYVANHDDLAGSIVYVIDVATRKVITTVPVGGFPASIAVTPDGSQVWVPARADSNVTVIDTLTNTVVTQINIDFPTGMAFNPTGTTAYVAAALLGSTPGYIGVIDTGTYAITKRITVGVLPHVVKVSPSGHHVFVTNGLSNSISQIDANTNTVRRTIKLPAGKQHPLGITFIH